ncbi:hypothetical protein M9458_026197, partial [Cirrhinus mrigala]
MPLRGGIRPNSMPQGTHDQASLPYYCLMGPPTQAPYLAPWAAVPLLPQPKP